MTLIAGWKCDKGIVLHADSQETAEVNGIQYRKTVQKIDPLTIGNYDVALAGAGNAPLVLSLIEKVKRKLSTASSQGTNAFASHVESELARFYRDDVQFCPDDDKEFKLIVAATCRKTGEYGAWTSQNMTLCSFGQDEPELVGWNESLYHEVAKKFFVKGMSIAQSVLAGVYLLTLAEATVNCVRGPFQVAVVRENGIWMESAGYVEQLKGRLKDYEQKLNRAFLACADTSIHVYVLEKILNEFMLSALELHREHIDRNCTMESIVKMNSPYPKLPLGSLISQTANGRLSFEHDREKLEETEKRFKERLALFFKTPVHAECAECHADLEFYFLRDHKPADWACPSCGAPMKTLGRMTRFQRVGENTWTDITPSASQTSKDLQ